MPASVAVPIGAAVIGAGASIYAGSQAAHAQEAAANTASQAQLQMYNQTRADNMPWHDAGVTALNQIQTGVNDGSLTKPFTLADYTADPGYAFRLQQGTQALERSAAARGGLLSGGFDKDLTNYAQGAASNEYQNAYTRYTNDQTARFNKLAAIAGIGQTANQNNQQAGQQMANGISQAANYAGNARSSAYQNLGSSINSGINNALYAYQTRPGAPGTYNTFPDITFNTPPAFNPNVGLHL